MEWNASYSEWAEKMVQESLVLLIGCIVGYILGAVALFLAMLALFVFGMLTMLWWLVVAFTLPMFYSIMVVGRTFAIYPGVWVLDGKRVRRADLNDVGARTQRTLGRSVLKLEGQMDNLSKKGKLN